jgi:hypothetical protein
MDALEVGAPQRRVGAALQSRPDGADIRGERRGGEARVVLPFPLRGLWRKRLSLCGISVAF